MLSIFINVSSDNPKYLVFYEELETSEENVYTSNVNENSKASSSLNSDKTSNSPSTPVSYNPKRAKLDYDAFTKKLR